MKGKLLTLAAASTLAIGFMASGAAQAGSKFTASTGPMDTSLQSGSLGTTTSGQVMSASIHTPNKKDLLIGVSMETMLTTRTRVKSKGGKEDTQAVLAGIAVWVEVDGQMVSPGKVVFDEREQEMTAIFGGVIESCQDTGTFTDEDTSNDNTPDGIITVADECVVTDEELELMLRTTAAHHFNWIAPDLSSGDHTITVHTEITTDDDLDNDTVPGEAVAMYGKRTLSVEEVQAINQDGGIIQF